MPTDNNNSPKNGARLRFGLDCAAAHFPYPPGVARVVEELIPRLAASPRGPTCIPLVPPAGISERKWRHRHLPLLERQLALTGILSFTSAFPLAGRGLRIQTIHELPWKNGEAENAGAAHRLWARHGRRRAAQILVPSEHVLLDLKDFAPRAAALANVIPWGVGEPFLLRPEVPAHIELPSAPFFLAAGASRAKKRLSCAIRGLAALPADQDSAPCLLVTGSISPVIERAQELAQSLNVHTRVHFLGRVDDTSLAALNHRAAASLVLARSEGFAFPALEALAGGAPVVCPPKTTQAELAAESAFFTDPEQPDSVARALKAALEEVRSQDTAKMRAARQKRASEFTWERSTLVLEDVLLRAARS
jgi:glycosyltransferase involved in cell wall biosynthesis